MAKLVFGMMQSLDGCIAGVLGGDEVEHDFAAAWRAQPKWVVSRTLKSVGPNATLVRENVEAFVRNLKADIDAVRLTYTSA